MTKTMTLEEMKKVNGGTLMDALMRIAGAGNGGLFNIGDRVLDTRMMLYGTITQDSYDYGHNIWLYTVQYDGGTSFSSIPESDLQAA